LLIFFLLIFVSDVICKLSKAAQVRFVIGISSSDSELGAVAESLSEAMPTAVVAVEHFKSPLPIVEKAANGLATIDDGIGVAKSISETWSPLLDKVKLFSSLVDEIAEVSPLSPHGFAANNMIKCRSILMQKWLGAFYL
jgi:hypothetical protein